jgi:FkbM family methyltransferase
MIELKNTWQETLKGGFGGLFGEVVTEDVYCLRKLTWTPDIIFDLGGNVGIFSHFCRQLWPNVLIIAVEPDIENYEHFKKFVKDDNMILINAAIGSGNIYRVQGAINGAHEVYLSNATGFSEEGLKSDERMLKTETKSITVAELVEKYLKPSQRSIMKIDIEGNENSIWEHEPSMEAIKKMDYMTLEIHRIALNGKDTPNVNELTDKALDSFEDTHYTRQEHVIFFAYSKKIPMEIKHRIELVDLLKYFHLPLTGVEVGAAEGYNSADLLNKGMQKLFIVDAWQTLDQTGDGAFPQTWHDDNYAKAVERVKPYGDKAVILRGLSTEMAANIPDESLGLVYLDAAHDYENVKKDLEAYFPKLVSGGIMAGHDVLAVEYGVKQAVEEFCNGKYEIHIIEEDPEHPEYASFYFIKK